MKNKKIVDQEEILKMNTTAWPFYLDQMPPYVWEKNFLSPEQCDEIIEYGKSLVPTKGLIGGSIPEEKTKNTQVRSSNISWIKPVKQFEWLYRKITDSVVSLNHEYYKFDIFGSMECLQFTNYKAPGDHYIAHTDRGTGIIIRKLSVTIQLSDPKDYKGGDLTIYESANGTKVEKERGMLIVFPSFMLHEVTPVKKGERNSLVCWVTGNQFK